jgi:large conductance mechanosensitive channel
MTILNDFKKFILRGNVVDLAVGVVIGAAFGSVVTALVKDIITPIISIPGKINFPNLTLKVGGGEIAYGDFLNTVISFLLIAASVFFFIVRPVNWLMERRKTDTPAEAATRECPFCVSSIPIAATRCPFCTSEVPASETAAAAAP